MKLSFKYKFIFAFVAIEIFFVLLIVFFNFSLISNVSKTLIDENIKIGSELFIQLVKVPLIIDDIATIDDSVNALGSIEHVSAIQVLNNENKIISSFYGNGQIDRNIFLKKPSQYKIGEYLYDLRVFPIKEGGELLGHAKIIFNHTALIQIIKTNKSLTYLLILLEILFSVAIAYIIGNTLTTQLESLATAANQIAHNNKVKIPYAESSSYEISTLANTLVSMQEKILLRDNKLKELSIKDALTQLFNRRYFDEIFDKEMSRARRDKKIFCLLSLDVDNFKSYNDTYGHQMGDDVLAGIGKILNLAMKRSSDFAFRIGGEEFSAIYNASDEKGVYEFAENIRKEIENQKTEHRENKISPFVTASFGVTFIDFADNNNLKTNEIELYKYTDDLLYKAKKGGKNIVVVHKFVHQVT